MHNIEFPMGTQEVIHRSHPGILYAGGKCEVRASAMCLERRPDRCLPVAHKFAGKSDDRRPIRGLTA